MPLIASSGDWHFGAKSGLPQQNQDLHDFVAFMIAECKKRDCTVFVHTGDWFDNRAKVDVPTLNSAILAMDTLSVNFNKVYVLKGNHDIFHKHTRETSSLNIFGELTNVKVVEDTHQLSDDVLLSSWICTAEEYDNLVSFTKKNKKIKYLFGHFEFSNFKMNEYYIMEHGISHRELKHLKKIISGHYHTRQIMDNVIYNGSPFPFDYGNSNEFDHGFSILDTDSGEVEYIVYDKIKIFSMSGREFLDFDINTMSQNDSIRIVIDERHNESDMHTITEKLQNLSVRDTKLVYKTDNILDSSTTVDINLDAVMSIDETVVSYLEQMTDITADEIDKDILISIYRHSIEQ